VPRTMPRNYRPSSNDMGMESLAVMVLVVSVMLIAGGIWLLVKAGSLVVGVVATHHASRVLQVSLGLVGVTALAVLATQGHSEPVDVLAGLSLLVLVGVSWIIESGHGATQERVELDSVMTSPWWDDA
jgi:hypothetical protein